MRKHILWIAIGGVGALVLAIAVFYVVVADGWFGPIKITMHASRYMFEGAVIAGPTDQQDFLVIVSLSPMENHEAEEMVRYLRSGCVVSLELSEQPDQPPILISDVTKSGEVIIRCKNADEANKLIDRLQAGPGQKKT
jgi:hypothetical protein